MYKCLFVIILQKQSVSRKRFLYELLSYILLRIEKMNFIICYLFDTADCNGLNDHSLEIKNNAIVGIIAITDAAMIKA